METLIAVLGAPGVVAAVCWLAHEVRSMSDKLASINGRVAALELVAGVTARAA